MNNEIKEILARLSRYVITPDVRHDFDDLLDYITNLQEKVEQYENPDDYTLFYMWLDEKAKDKMKKLQEENENLKNIVSSVKKDFLNANSEAIELEQRIDKAIEYGK